MDRKQMVVERTRIVFGERLDDVVHMVRQDRQDLRGWEEPTHIRGVLRRRTLRANNESFSNNNTENNAEVIVGETEFGRGAGEPDRGQQRECVGQLLEAGANALEKVARQVTPDLNNEERLGLECVLLLYGRPAVEVDRDRLAPVSPFWNVLEDQREDIEMAQRGVGRIELFGHPEYDWAGTAFLVNETTLMTTRRTAEIFIENRNEQWQFRPGITAWMDYNSDYQRVASAGYRVRTVLGVHNNYDLALLEVEPPQFQPNGSPTPLALAAQPPGQLEGRQVYLVGYPVRDARRNEPEFISRIFRDSYNVKRVMPGVLRGFLQFRDLQLVQHDCAVLGQSTGGCLIDLETQQVLGLHLSSRYLEPGTAIPLWVLRDDPLLQRCGVTFAQATSVEMRSTSDQLERLARSRYWNDVRNTIATYYQRAFGNTTNNPR
jgi:hypothetical protein